MRKTGGAEAQDPNRSSRQTVEVMERKGAKDAKEATWNQLQHTNSPHAPDPTAGDTKKSQCQGQSIKLMGTGSIMVLWGALTASTIY